MNNTYILKTDSTIEALDAIDNFITKMELFESKYKDYKHDIHIESIDDMWNVELTIKNEKENIKTL